jgi:low temperature requirement protein LtrA
MARIHRPLARLMNVAMASEGDRVTTLELFFDLVYVFAFTQVTALMSHGRPPGSLLDGLIVLSLLWWSWAAFSWLANQAHADEGIVQCAFIVAMVAVFIACLALPDAFKDASSALVLVACYTAVRLTHAGAYLVAARRDPRLRRQVIVTVLASLVPTVALLVAGVAAGHPGQGPVWLAAVLYDFGAVFVSAVTSQGWQIQSAAHFAERHGLVVILALGESIVAIAAGLGSAHLSWRIALGAALSILIAVGLYLAYFARLPGRLEEALERAQGTARAKLAQDVYSYFHFPVIAGIIVTALGIETAMEHLSRDHLGSTGGWALGGGVALFLAGAVASQARACGTWPVPRVAAIVVLTGISPLLSAAPALAAVGIVAAATLTLAVIDAAAGPRPRRAGKRSVRDAPDAPQGRTRVRTGADPDRRPPPATAVLRQATQRPASAGPERKAGHHVRHPRRRPPGHRGPDRAQFRRARPVHPLDSGAPRHRGLGQVPPGPLPPVTRAGPGQRETTGRRPWRP